MACYTDKYDFFHASTEVQEEIFQQTVDAIKNWTRDKNHIVIDEDHIWTPSDNGFPPRYFVNKMTDAAYPEVVAEGPQYDSLCRVVEYSMEQIAYLQDRLSTLMMLMKEKREGKVGPRKPSNDWLNLLPPETRRFFQKK